MVNISGFFMTSRGIPFSTRQNMKPDENRGHMPHGSVMILVGGLKHGFYFSI